MREPDLSTDTDHWDELDWRSIDDYLSELADRLLALRHYTVVVSPANAETGAPEIARPVFIPEIFFEPMKQSIEQLRALCDLAGLILKMKIRGEGKGVESLHGFFEASGSCARVDLQITAECIGWLEAVGEEKRIAPPGSQTRAARGRSGRSL